jgi:Potential Queuosine, Q, salvage protein family
MLPYNSCQKVRHSAEFVMSHSKHVQVNQTAITNFVNSTVAQSIPKIIPWEECHFPVSDYSIEEVLTFIFVIDTLNFCFWPHPSFEYDHLTRGVITLLKEGLLKDYKYLQSITPKQLKLKVFNNIDFILIEERARMIREVFSVLKDGCLHYLKEHKFNAIEVMV